MTKSKIITRTWHGKTPATKADAYLEFLFKTGVIDYTQTPGIQSVKIQRNIQGEEAHFWTVTEWKSFEDIKGFAGEDYAIAKYYEEDNDFLLEKEKFVNHTETFQVFGGLKQLIGQLQGLYDGNNWVYISVTEILKDISFETAIQKKLPKRNTIHEILQHSLSWRTLLLKKLEGDQAFDIQQNDDLDWPKTAVKSEDTWKQLVKDFHKNQEDLVQILSKKDDRILFEVVPGRNYNFKYLIHGVIQHDYYHFGQIALLK